MTYVVLGTTVHSEVGALVNKSAAAGVSAGVGGAPERAAEVDSAKRAGVDISIGT
jgi:hypothetical protein